MIKQKLTIEKDQLQESIYINENFSQLEQKQRLASSNQELRRSLRHSTKMRRLINGEITEVDGGVENYDYFNNKSSDLVGKNLCNGKLITKNIDKFVIKDWLKEVEFLVTDEERGYFSEIESFLNLEEIRNCIDLHGRVVNINEINPFKLAKMKDITETVASLNQYLDGKTIPPSEPLSNDVKELFLLINHVHMKNIFEIVGLVHSIFATKNDLNDPGLLKVISLQKNGELMGMTIENEMGSTFVSRIVSGGQVDQSGLLNVRDELISVSGTRLTGTTVDEAQLILRRLRGDLKFVILQNNRVLKDRSEPSYMYLRTLFTYNPEDDEEIPCVELGISFGKRSILAVIDTSDEHWWQVRQDEDSGDSIYGIIPSPSMQHYREREKKRRAIEMKNKYASLFKKTENYSDILPSYEEVVLHYPDNQNKSVIILIGPDDDTLSNIIDNLLKTYSDLFTKPIKHTTRKRKISEIDSIHFNFISNKNFKKSISYNKFFEHSFSAKEKCLYGTMISSIRKVIPTGRHCVVHCSDCQSLRGIQETSFFPYVVFICPPNIQVLREQLPDIGELELRDIIDKGRFIEDKYGRYIDEVIINRNLSYTINQIMHAAKKVDSVPQWVPIKWIKN